jgi:imidazolonepropionase-like amidohydrolase
MIPVAIAEQVARVEDDVPGVHHNMMRLYIVLLALGSLAVSSQGPAFPIPYQGLSLINANVVNVVDGSVRRNAVVRIREGRIESIGTENPPDQRYVPVDVRGRYLLPGLIDAHVHIANLRALRTALESGITTVRSAGVSNYVDVGMRELVRKGAIVGPDVLAAGYHVRPVLAEEAFIDRPSLADLLVRRVISIEAMRRVVQANLAHGVDWIKVLATERAGTPDTDPRKQVYTEEELRAIVQEAATKNVPVEAHAHGAEGALAAIKAGVRSIEHGTYLTDDTLKLMAQRGTFFDPTADVVNDLAQPGGDYDNAGLQRRGQTMKPVLVDTIRRARAAGVKVVAGSDTGYGPTSIARISREILELIEAGFTPLAALQSATTVNAELLRLEKQVGHLRAGFEADLIVVDANPLEQPRTLLDPLLVMSNGRLGLDRLTFGKSAGARVPGLGNDSKKNPY